ncbi:sigma-70 family RNA polymerase sigma factor [Lactiplantibacillus sp. WILCCON 0030]|uniref:Sigma-70 family RNA polymerase sigma factor n=1 Tax=Lactiplantibacillus brownii TaxID=3069269 RepID=A0ABU1A846_9LACO|nr:sigma-70 family RNA polymerase sigma factor [Lactiplantibacillus brownii]MDQ7936515.1 sigma-70 family RNA polymerase sigma factor [Lactiplantibacillus brownii]
MDEQQLIGLAKSGDTDALLRLTKQYVPVANKLQRQYFIRSYDDDDWGQEALIMMHRATQQYDHRQACSFGAFYRLLLNNRVIDLIRRAQAQKRRPDQEILSLDYEAAMILEELVGPEQLAIDILCIHEVIRRFVTECSKFENQVFEALLHGLTPQGIAAKLKLELAPVINAIDRCRRKLRALLLD